MMYQWNRDEEDLIGKNKKKKLLYYFSNTNNQHAVWMNQQGN